MKHILLLPLLFSASSFAKTPKDLLRTYLVYEKTMNSQGIVDTAFEMDKKNVSNFFEYLNHDSNGNYRSNSSFDFWYGRYIYHSGCVAKEAKKFSKYLIKKKEIFENTAKFSIEVEFIDDSPMHEEINAFIEKEREAGKKCEMFSAREEGCTNINAKIEEVSKKFCASFPKKKFSTKKTMVDVKMVNTENGWKIFYGETLKIDLFNFKQYSFYLDSKAKGQDFLFEERIKDAKELIQPYLKYQKIVKIDHVQKYIDDLEYFRKNVSLNLVKEKSNNNFKFYSFTNNGEKELTKLKVVFHSSLGAKDFDKSMDIEKIAPKESVQKKLFLPAESKVFYMLSPQLFR